MAVVACIDLELHVHMVAASDRRALHWLVGLGSSNVPFAAEGVCSGKQCSMVGHTANAVLCLACVVRVSIMCVDTVFVFCKPLL